MVTDLEHRLRKAFDALPSISVDQVHFKANRRRRLRRRIGVTGGALAAAAALVIALVVIAAPNASQVNVAAGGGIPSGVSCPRLVQVGAPAPESSVRLQVPGFDAALVCSYIRAPTGRLELSALAVSTTVLGRLAAQLRAALRAAPVWHATPTCAAPSPEDPVIQTVLYRNSNPVGTMTVYLTGCQLIQGPRGQSEADAAFRAELKALLGAGGAVAAGPMAGIWHVHTYYLTLTADGHGVFNWPIHATCGTGPGDSPPPCDTLRADGEIIDGGYATLTIIGRNGSSATGLIKSSTDTSTLPVGPVTLQLADNDVLYLHTQLPPASRAYDYLCGPRAIALPVAEQNAQHINCGA